MQQQEKKARAKCTNSCCEVITKRMCMGCEKEHVCKKHNKCESCKTGKTTNVQAQPEKTEVAVSPEKDKKDKARERARNYYRIKQGIPIDAPLIQRGGAHNVKYHTEAEKAERAEMEKEYQKEYQKKYREKKAKEEEMRQTIIKNSVYAMSNFRDVLQAKKETEFANIVAQLAGK